VFDYGFRCVIAPSYADIFFNNCFKNGVLPIVFPENQIDQLFANVATHGQYELTIDLESQTVQDGYGLEFSFDVNEFRRHCLLNGLDDIALTLEHEAKITAFEQRKS
jgi:3-isopropylmalate/(R)-2-methylmalate dehydratase small subunit